MKKSQERRAKIHAMVYAGKIPIEQAIALLAELDEKPHRGKVTRTTIVTLRNSARAVDEYLRRVFPGVEEKNLASLTVEVSPNERLYVSLRNSVRKAGIEHDARNEALRAFQDVFRAVPSPDGSNGGAPPRRSEFDMGRD